MRKNADPGFIYVYHDGSVSWSPDGEGKIWFDTVDEARAQVGDLLTVEGEELT